MKKHLKVLLLVLTAAISAGTLALAACNEDEIIVEDSGSYITINET